MHAADALRMLEGVLAESHLSTEDEVGVMLAEHGRMIGADNVVLYLADYDQRFLVPLPSPLRTVGRLDIDATVGGWCFRNVNMRTVPSDGGTRVWVPVVDGSERLGVLEVHFQAAVDEHVEDVLPSLATVAAELVLTKRVYGDLFERLRRTRPMSLAAELLWRLLPPLTFGTEDVVITAGIAPVHDVGGDAFDYAVNGDTARFAIFDALGHGLGAGLIATVALAAYRNSRRAGFGLIDTVAAIDDAIAAYVGQSSYATGVLAELDLRSGQLRWCIAGHPRPMIVRRGRAVRTLVAGASVPFGLGARPSVGTEMLEPYDRVFLYTDGITDGRGDDNEPFGIERFIDLVSRTTADGAAPPETMRRLMHAVIDHQVGVLRDDASALIVQWPGGAAAEKLQIENTSPGG